MFRRSHAFENRLRTPWEFMVAAIAIGFAVVIYIAPDIVAVEVDKAPMFTIPFLLLAALRAYQGSLVLLYRKRLLTLKKVSIAIEDIPISKDKLYVGLGFRWQAIHRQRLHLLKSVKNQVYLKKAMKRTALGVELGGKPWLHGVGADIEREVFLNQANRNSHMVIFGTTRVGKSRLMSILVSQDIRNGEAVLVIDPKGDVDVLRDMHTAAKCAGRLDDFKILHAGMPSTSAKYNPLKRYSDVSEVATRVTSAIRAEGEGKQFQDFAWKFINIVAACLEAMGEVISYQSLAYYAFRPRDLFVTYCDRTIPDFDSEYKDAIEIIIDEHTKTKASGKIKKTISRLEAVKIFVAEYINNELNNGNYGNKQTDLIADLYYAANMSEEYYSKITASLAPALDKINKTEAGEIFSWQSKEDRAEINLEEVVKNKEIIYIGLDSMSNRVMSEAVGQALIADLVSLCGKLYKDSSELKDALCLYADEFSEVVRDEFVTLLNKAGGAGVRVTALAQTVNDLSTALGSNHDKAKMLLGNFGTVGMMKIENKDTAEVFTECLEQVQVRSIVPSTMANDHHDVKQGQLFTTYNTDQVVEETVELVQVNDLFSLPKGQVFFVTNGGELYKLRVPLSINHHSYQNGVTSLLQQVNIVKK